MSNDTTPVTPDAPKPTLRERARVAVANLTPSRDTLIIATVATVSMVSARIGTRQAVGDWNRALTKYHKELTGGADVVEGTTLSSTED